MKSFFGLLLAALLLAGTGSASAQYPDKAVTCIVPFAPGGAADVSVRMVADYLSKELGQPLVIVNKGGGSGIPGLNFGLKAKNDGYTVIGGAIGNALVATYFLKAPAYNLDDLIFVGAYMPQDRLLLTRPDKPYKTWKELVDYAKAHPAPYPWVPEPVRKLLKFFTPRLFTRASSSGWSCIRVADQPRLT